ncbi:uncharacterized protein [Hemitrygon akajei]|uniref:uncharacterized protein isoform X1 n=1 Tax=Hemitrygon akajei TaxID=2704970 RepID=UPI003BF9C911
MRSTVCLAMDRAESGVIATTPPVTCNMEERLSQASSLGSGTHLSNVSGFSLGEAIVQQAKQGSELWPQLQSEAGTGEVTSATASSLLLGGTDCTQTLEEFPTMEEGTITITEELGSPHSEFGPFQTLQMFELQKSDLSPALALVATCSMEGNMSQSIHHSPLEFAPLRPAPDLSGVSHEGCPGAFRANSLLEPFVSAVSSGHVKGSPSSREEQTSQHGSDAWTLSQCPLKSPTPGSEATEDEDMSRTDSYIQDQHFMELPSLPLGRELYRVPFLDCGPLLAQGVPTHPLSEQLDLLGNSGMQTAGVHSNQSSGPPRLGTITHGTMTSEVDGWRDTDQQCSSAEDGQASPQPAQNQRDPEISYQHQPGVEAAQPSCPDGSHEPSSAGGPDASGSGNTTGTGLVTSITNTHTPNNGKDDTAIEVLPNRGSKEQESHMSPVVCPLSCTDSFITPTVAAPLCQSTPTSYPSGQGKRAVGHQPESSGPLDFLSAPCCEELESHSASWEPVQSSPGTKRSLLPLGYLEKARASNPVMPLSFDSLVLRGLRGVSPRQRAYSAIADSLNHMLAQSRGQDLGRSPKRNIAVAFGAGPKSVQTAGRIGRCSQAGTGSDSQDPASICKPDRSPCLPKDVGNCSVDSMASDSANSEGLQPGHSAAGLLQQDVLPDPSSSNGQEEDSLEQNSSLPEHRILSPFPEPLVADHTHQFETTFTDDGTNPQASSLDTSQAGEHTLTVSGHSLTSLEVDNYVPTWAPSSLTPEINHFNIDDRIPVYLRNLGINQSPTSILGSRGLLKEVEFNTSEQKILQEAGLGRFSVAEEVSAKDRDSVCTFYSDVLTHSTSITLGVETGQNTPGPGGPLLGVAEMKGLEPCPPGSNSSTWHPVQALPNPKDSLGYDGVRDSEAVSLNRLENATASSLLLCSSPGGRGVLAVPVADPGATETPLPSPGGCRTYHLHCSHVPRQDDSFIGSKTLSEIRRLLGGERVTNSGQDEATELGYDEKEEPLCQWNQSKPLTQRSEAEVGAVRVHPPTGGNPKGTISSLPMEVEPVSVRRSSRVEPEGCSGANLGRVVPKPDPGHHSPDSPQLTTSTSHSQAVPCLPGQPSRAWAPISNPELGDSVDSSHVDIPDARETNPLAVCHSAALARNFSPAVQTMDPTIPGGEETKRSAQTLDPLSMLDEEDRRKIEEIKAELLQKAKTSIGLQCAWSVTAKDSSLVSDPGWPACPLPTCLPLSSTRSRIHTQDWGPSDKQWNMDKLLGTLGAGSPPTPIAAITICSRRKPPSSSPSLSASLLMAPSDHEQFPAHLHEAKVSAIEPAQCLESVVGDEGQCPQEDRHIAKPITVRQDVAEAAEGLTDGDSISAPLRSPTRTVMSHIRVTLSPNRSRSPLSPSGKSLLLSGTQPSPPAQHPIPATASPSPPYPPLPMPMPVICPTFPSLVDHSPGATFPGTGQPQGQDSPETRTVTVQGSSKVDVSTQTSGLAFAPAAGSMLSQAAGQDVGVWSEGTPSVPAPVTGGTTDVSGHGLTTDVPLMLPYKPAGSSRLFYMPSSGARHRIGLMDSKNSGEISQADLNNVPPPGPQSQVLPPSGSHTALGKGTEHWNSRKTVASKVTRSKEGRDPRSHRSLHTQRAGGLENSPRQRAEGEGAQYRANRHPKERQRMAGSRHAPLQHAKREAWLEPCPLEGESGLSYKERAKAVVRSAWEQPVPGHRPRGSALDELWERFQERQQRHWSLNSSTASELSLLQRLDRLAQLLRDPRPLAAGRPRSPSTTSMAEISTDHVRFLHDPGSSSPRVPSTESATSGPSDSSSAASTIDTARLIRAFGPERVLPLDRLYGTIQRQREHPAPRRERPRKGETRYPGTRKVSTPQALTVSSSTSDSVAGRRGSAWPPHGPSSRLLSKKVTRLVDQGVQTGSLEIVPGATRRQTRDVGVTFPSPDPDVSLQRLTGPRDRRKGVSQTERKASKGHRTPAIAWYIPAHELQGDWRKENTNDQYRPVQAWAQRGLVPQPWREPLRQRHLQDQWVSKEARDTWPPPPSREDGVGGKFPSTLVPLTLREALTMNKPWFISHSQERVRRLALLVEERKLQSEFQSERDRLFNQPPSRGFREWRGQRPDYSILFKKKISKQEMLDRSKRLYEQLPEVVRRREEEKRKTEYRANRLKAQLYKQKITNRVLGKKVSWQ